ncbi:hypothetical protein C8J56DRAFT_821455 [Mycena floridula]|nr:hypothetical protein C8J56DRAFT_821455 [Mycena floridula]
MTLKRNPSRAPSPTPTAFSGISNYRNDSYRPIRDKNVPSVPAIDYRLVSKTHFDELNRSLAAYLAKAPPNSRSTARQKLTRLTIQQFHELSTDVYDELVRRKKEKEVPFLPVREDFHPKRNQARQKLATLPISRFEDLSSDVYYELARRYPEFKEDPSGRVSAGSAYDDLPAPDFPSNSAPRATNNNSRTSGRTSADRGMDSGYGGSVSSRRPSEDIRRRPSDANSRRSEEAYSRAEESYGNMSMSSNSMSSRRRPSQDTTRRSEDRDYSRRPGLPLSMSGNSDSTVNATQSTTATSAMIIPNKSTMEEEYIEVPYGRDTRESVDGSRDNSQEVMAPGPDADIDSASDYPSPMSNRGGPSGLSGLSARLKGADDDDESGAANKSGDDYYALGRSMSAGSDRSGTGISSRLGGRTSVADDHEQIKRDYEFKIATMQTQISSLQRDLGDADQKERKWKEGEAKAQQMEEELVGLRRRAEEQTAAMRALQKELDEARETRQREKEREARRAQQDEDELQILRDRCERLEEEREVNMQTSREDPDVVEQLRSDMQSLISELGDLSRRNDELMTAKDSDLVVIRDLDNQLKDYKRKYEQAKTELRSVKATSQLFLQAPKMDKLDDQLPISNDGGVLDIHVTAFLSAVDALLTAGRSNAPTRVLTPMKSIVNVVSSIIEDVRNFERRPQRERSDVDVDALRALCDRADTTLSNLVTASKTHATSSGLSPVSLLDAAASHVSATITDICRTVCIRKASQAEQEQFASSAPTATSSVINGFSPSLRSVEEKGSPVQRKGSAPNGSRYTDGSPANRSYTDSRRRPPSDNSSSDNTNSPPPIFDQPTRGFGSSDSITEGSEDNWAELKPYLEAQTESIVYAIQAVLSGVRAPTPSPNLGENLTQIITIVTSIVAVCTDNLPPTSAQQGTEILRELSEHANKLSEVQALPEVTKESRQVMAKSSFAVANAMKGLMKL